MDTMKGKLKIKRWLEAPRAPKQSYSWGGSYTPSGIDIYTTDDPEIVALRSWGDQRVRVDNLLTILNELDRYESRRHLSGERMELRLNLECKEADKGDVYHRPGWMKAEGDPKIKGLVQLTVFSEHSSGAYVLTAERKGLREALESRKKLEELEAEDKQRLKT